MKHISEHEGNATFSSMDFAQDSKGLYYLTNEGSEFMYLKKYDIENDSHETIMEKDWDIWYSYLSREGTYRITGTNSDAKTEIEILNTKTNELIDFPSEIQGDIKNVRISESEKLMTFWVGSSKTPSDLYLYSFEDNSVELMASTLNPELNKDELVEGEVVRYPSFDSLDIPAILYKPHQASKDNKVPALVWIHGGPGGQSRLSYFPLIQYLVNHGYAILAVNNRGSSGYGKTFYAMDNQNHGEGDLQDCVEGKNYLATLDYVDGEKIGIIGGSYGGFMVMAALTKHPEEFNVGVNIFGVTNWLRTLKSIPAWWESFREALYSEMGNPETDSVRLYEISPLFHADKITKPFMVLQGAQDPRVLQVESDEIVEAARANGVFVEYVLFEDEGHGFVKKENQIEGYGKVLTFLNEHLKMEMVEETAMAEEPKTEEEAEHSEEH
jgi:dipeptidyl aminopeptidase/acylaminoacyl peptidase